MENLEQKFLRDEEFLRYFKKGRHELDNGNFEAAVEFLEKAYKLSPESEGVENLLGMLYFRMENYKKAETIYRKLVGHNPYIFTLRANLGLIYFKEKKYFDSVKELNEAVKLKPDYSKAHNYLGLVYAELGKYKSAREEFLRAGSRNMAKKVEEIIAGIRDPESLQIDGQEERETVPLKEKIPIGDLILDPELKKMLDDFEEDRKFIGEENRGSDVEHIHLDMGNEGLVAMTPKRKVGPKSTGEKEFKSSFYLGLDEGESGSTSVNLLNINFSGYTYGRVKGLIAAEGQLDFEPVKKSYQGKPSNKDLGGEDDPIMKIVGDGKIILSPDEKKLKIINITSEDVLYLKEPSILAFQSGISWENGKISLDKNNLLELIQLKGQGDIAILFNKYPVEKQVSEDSPFKVSANAIIGWQGKVIPKVVHITQKKEGGEETNIPFIEFTGKGKVIIE